MNVISDEGKTAAQRVEQHDTQRVDIGLRARRCSAEKLRCHERGRARQRGAALGEVIEASNQPEVGELGAAVGREQHVGGLHVAVDEPGVVSSLEGEHDLLGEDRGA